MNKGSNSAAIAQELVDVATQHLGQGDMAEFVAGHVATLKWSLAYREWIETHIACGEDALLKNFAENPGKLMGVLQSVRDWARTSEDRLRAEVVFLPDGAAALEGLGAAGAQDPTGAEIVILWDRHTNGRVQVRIYPLDKLGRLYGLEHASVLDAIEQGCVSSNPLAWNVEGDPLRKVVLWSETSTNIILALETERATQGRVHAISEADAGLARLHSRPEGHYQMSGEMRA